MSASVWAPGTSIDANNSIKQQAFVATAGQTIFNLTDFTYVNGTGSLYVFVAGGAQRPGVDFFERSTSQFELSTGAPEGAIVLALGFVEVSAILDTLLTYSPQYQVMTAGQTVVNFSTTYVPGVASLAIYYNGLRLAVNVDYTETSISSITLANPALVGDTVYSMIGQEIVSTDAVDAFVVSYTPAGTGAVATNVRDKLRESVSVKDFGAVGDGVINDTTAFQLAANYINAQDGGTLIIPAGTYIVGRQTFGGGVNAYARESILYIHDCTSPVVVQCDGAIIKMADGLRMGSFNPVTGAPYFPGAFPFTNQTYAADPGIIFQFYLNTGGVAVLGSCELDGNLENYVVGGQWGDTGYQRLAYGLYSYGNSSLYAENVHTHRHGTDGVVCGWTGALAGDDATPVTLVNVNSEYNGRQGLSWVGGVGFTAINCKFNHTGRTVNIGTGTAFGSSPGAGLDIEAESAVCRNGVFDNCEFINNSGLAMGADSGDSADVSFNDCVFVGTTNAAIWPRKPGLKFNRCRIYGLIYNQFQSLNRNIANVFTDCLITDQNYGSYVTASTYTTSTQLFGTAPSLPIYFDRCTFWMTKFRLGRLDYSHHTECHFQFNADVTGILDTNEVVTLTAAFLNNCTFDCNITGTLPANAYMIFWGALPKTTGRNVLTNTAGIVRWASWSTGAGGFIGELGRPGTAAGDSSTVKVGQPYLALFKNDWSSNYYGQLVVRASTAKPASGTYAVGDITLNQTLTARGVDYWKCTVAGTPGTWVARSSGGTFTCAAAALTTVSNINIIATSMIMLMPTNAAAATLMGGATSLYVSARTAATSFGVTTANAAAAAGTETFEYLIIN
jgi:hypothetical protein